jgi:protein O-mannosyl-transferase
MGSKHKRKFRASQNAEAVIASGREPATSKEAPTPHHSTAITTLRAILIIVGLGLAVFFSGFRNPFIADDYAQIIDNTAVHSISNVAQFFQGGTYLPAPGSTKLSGIYYRPLMTTAFSLIYTVFGSSPLPYHLFQLLLHVLSCIFLFMIFRFFFKPVLALTLSLVFLVHPINSEAVFAIPSIQEPLFFLFGIVAFWSLVRFQYQSTKYLILTVVCLLLSLLSKESGLLFVFVSALYVFWFDRKRFLPFIYLVVPVLILYAVLRVHAVGALGNPSTAPIAQAGVIARLFTIPSIVTFYITILVIPLKLASGYFWVYRELSIQHFVLPLIVDAVVLAMAYLAYKHLKRRCLARQSYIFRFFAIWVIVGLIMHLQITPLDFTVSETWLYFPLAGILGMIGALVDEIPLGQKRKWAIGIVTAVLFLFAARTSLRGLDWKDRYTLALHDIEASKEDHVAEAEIGLHYLNNGDAPDAKAHAERSIGLYPSGRGYDTLGLALLELGDYSGAKKALYHALDYDVGSYQTVVENLATLAIYYGDAKSNIRDVRNWITYYPHDGQLWLCLAILQDKNDNAAARMSIERANENGRRVDSVYSRITNNEQITLTPHPSIRGYR